jgi:hypothetical protein
MIFNKSLGATEFYEKIGQKKVILSYFCCHLIQNLPTW